MHLSKTQQYSLIVLLLLMTVGCNTRPIQVEKSTTTTMVFAHRAGSGLWIQNSRNAVKQSLLLATQGQKQNRLQGIELDIVLTKDKVPVLSHDPWVHKALCQQSNGDAVNHILIKDISFQALTNNYYCGATSDPEFPTAQTYRETILGFDEFLDLIKTAPELAIYLDLKIQTDLTLTAEEYAKAIFSRLAAKNVRNPLYIEGPTLEALIAYRQYASRPFTEVLSYPPFYSYDNWTKTGIKTALKARLKPERLIRRVTRESIQAVASPTQVMHSRLQHQLQAIDKHVIVFTPNTEKAIKKACRSSVDILITDFPNKAGCD